MRCRIPTPVWVFNCYVLTPAQVTAKWTGIPVAQLLAPEREKLLHLPDALHTRVVGQDQAVDAVSDAIQRCASSETLSKIC